MNVPIPFKKILIVSSVIIFFIFSLVAFRVWYFYSLVRKGAAAYVDFNESMKCSTFSAKLNNSVNAAYYAFLKDIYQRNNFKTITPTVTARIPKVIHQIWLGSPFPERFKKNQLSWQKYNPDWEFKLWTDEEVKCLRLYNQEQYDKATNFGEKSDILRYELLYRYGGLYVDIDFECLQPMDIFHHYFDFYIGIQPMDTVCVQLGIGIIGSVPGHPMLKKCIQQIPLKKSDTPIIAKTGPIFFSSIFWQNAGKGKCIDVALPASYFYPKGYTQKDVPMQLWRERESFAVHHWAGSWLNQEQFQRKK